MPNIDAVLDTVFQEFSKTDSLKYCTRPPSFLAEKEFYCLWEIETEVDIEGSCKDIELFIAFQDTFPLSIPKIYLSDKLYTELKNAPHIDIAHFVCTYHTERIILIPDNPIGIVKLCLDRAKQIIRNGLLKNHPDDFYDELTSYWTNCKLNDEIEYLSLIQDYTSCQDKLTLYSLHKNYRHIKHILYSDKTDPLVTSVLKYLKMNGYNGEEDEVLFLNDCKVEPYLSLPSTNGDILDFIPLIHKKAFEKYINQKPYGAHVFFADSSVRSDRLLGWKHSPITTKQNGFRSNSLKAFDVFTKMQKKR